MNSVQSDGRFTEQADKILASQRRDARRFTAGVRLTYAVLLLVLAYAFSGSSLTLAGLQFNTISLDWTFIRSHWFFIFNGVWLTILLSVLSIALATALSLLGALGRLSKSAPAYALATFYISLIRGTPLLLQVVFFFLALPQLGIRLSGITAGVLALGLNYGAYMTEIMRAGIQSVDVGQREAAKAMGMTQTQIMRFVVLPQALRLVIPPIGNQFIAMLKDTSLISVTGFVWELLWRAQKQGRANFRSLEALLIAAIFYWIITIIFTAFQAQLERRLSEGYRTAL